MRPHSQDEIRVHGRINSPGRNRETGRGQKFGTSHTKCRTHPDDGVELGHGDLLGPLDRGGDLLLVLLGEEGQDLAHDRGETLDDLRLQGKQIR